MTKTEVSQQLGISTQTLTVWERKYSLQSKSNEVLNSKFEEYNFDKSDINKYVEALKLENESLHRKMNEYEELLNKKDNIIKGLMNIISEK